MRLTRHPRRPSSLSKSCQQRLESYVLAATAAGVGTLALAAPAEGKIVYTPAHRVMSTSDPNQFHNLDLNHDGVVDFSFDAYVETGMSSQFAFLRCNPRAANDVWGVASSLRGHGDEGAFLPGVRIGPGGHYASHISMARVGVFTNGSTIQGPWANHGKGVKDRYLGLKFAINGKIHYGWARLNVTVKVQGGANITGTLTGYAYETVPNKAIVTGPTKGADVVTLAPAGLGHLARGAGAIPTWRTISSGTE